MLQETTTASAEAAGLNYVSDVLPGIRRLRAGKGFRYVGPSGPVKDKATLQRIRALAVPPAWTDVWISADPDGHLQATGRDARKRKQHRYHPRWRAVRDATKYDRLVEFGHALPKIRRRVGADLRRRAMDREKVLAAVVRLMDRTFIRVGNEEYARGNASYGLTTMEDRHVKVRGDVMHFRFRGKSGKWHEVLLEDPRLAKIVKLCLDIPGQELFQYYDEAGQIKDVTSGDVNSYLREASESDFSAKDFRTWAGSVLASEALGAEREHSGTGEANAAVKRAVEQVASRLGNTPAISRKCYIHPAIVGSYLEDGLTKLAVPANGNGKRAGPGLRPAERSLLAFLEDCRRQNRRRAKAKTKLPESWR